MIVGIVLQIREAAYKLYLYPNNHQLQLLDGLLESRNQLANLVGFPTYAHRALRGTLADSPGKSQDSNPENYDVIGKCNQIHSHYHLF